MSCMSRSRWLPSTWLEMTPGCSSHLHLDLIRRGLMTNSGRSGPSQTWGAALLHSAAKLDHYFPLHGGHPSSVLAGPITLRGTDLLVQLSGVVWLKPLLQDLKKGQAPLTHPPWWVLVGGRGDSQNTCNSSYIFPYPPPILWSPSIS